LERFTASDGGVIAYSDTGASSGRPLVLLHGLMAHSGFFREQEPLAGTFRLIGLDLRGHGQSVQTVGSCTVARAAQDVAELTQALDLRDAIGVGWSLGATILWHLLAGAEGQRFSAAVIIDMTARVRNGDGWELGLAAEACAARSAAMTEDFAAFAVGAGQAIFAQPVQAGRQATAEWTSDEFARNDPAAISNMWSSLEEIDVRPLLTRIEQPTLIVHGAQSSLYSQRTADHLVAALPHARAVRFALSGHAPHIEEPELFNRTITDFAATLPPTAITTKIKNRRIS
jgi:pimeloyl-[acyl-carrier protein] methyl ester esterase